MKPAGTFVRVDRDAWDALDRRFDAAYVDVGVRWTLFRLFREADWRNGFVVGSSRDLARRLGMGPVAFRSHRRTLEGMGVLRVVPATNQWSEGAGIEIVDYATLVEGTESPRSVVGRPSTQQEAVVGRSSSQQGSLIDPAESADQRKRAPEEVKNLEPKKDAHSAADAAALIQELGRILEDLAHRSQLTRGHLAAVEALATAIEEELIVGEVAQVEILEAAREGVDPTDLVAVRTEHAALNREIHTAAQSWPGGMDHLDRLLEDLPSWSVLTLSEKGELASQMRRAVKAVEQEGPPIHGKVRVTIGEEVA